MTKDLALSAAQEYRLAIVGEAALYGLHEVSHVVLSDSVDNTSPGVFMESGARVVIVWTDVHPEKFEEWGQVTTTRTIQGGIPYSHDVTVIVRRATWWIHVRAWARRKVWGVRNGE